jgi:nucleoid-associated protein YgaU
MSTAAGYTVVSPDTLWAISERFYGDVSNTRRSPMRAVFPTLT